MMKDLRHAARLLVRDKGWTLVVVLSLALGIGANTALFSAVNGLLMTKVPVADPDTLVRLRWMGRNDMVTNSNDYGFVDRGPDGQTVRATFSYPMYEQLLAANRTLDDLFACAPFGQVNVVVDGRAELASGFIASGNYYQALGVAARIGRTLLPDDDRAAAEAVAVISSRYWLSRFGGDPAVVGRALRVNDVVVTVVGVIAPGFTGIQRTLDDPSDIAVPLALQPRLDPRQGPSRLTQPTFWWLQVVGRLKPGATIAQVQGNLEGVFQATARAGFDSYLQSLTEAERGTAANRNRTEVPRLVVEPGARGVYDVGSTELRAVTILGVVVALVLLIVCANVANLLLSRATTRRKELSVRLALGATRSRLVRQLLTESLLLAALGGALGVLVGYWGVRLLPGGAGELTMTVMDWRVLAFVAIVASATGIVFGIAPALRGTDMQAGGALKETGRGVIATRSLLGKALLIVQVAISIVLLIGAGLFLRTLSNLRQVDVGFDPRNLLLFRVNPQLNRYDQTRTAALYRDMIERIGAVPGVRGVALSQPALLSGSTSTTSIYVQGRTYPAEGDRDGADSIHRVAVSPGFFDVMGIPLVLGRGVTDRDTETAPRVVVINEAAARRFFPDENPIGRRFGSSVETTGQYEIVGVARDAKYNSVRDAAPPTMYAPYLQGRGGSVVFEVRTEGSPTAAMGAIREVVRAIDPALPLTGVSTQIEEIERRFSQERLFAQAHTLFGVLALLVASVGLFGLMSYSVARRTNEIGVRLALGARRVDVLRLVMRESMTLVAVGVAAGLGLAVAAGRLVSTLLFGLPPTDQLSIAGAIAVMVIVSALAGYVPARRASRVDPMVALRYE